MLTKTTETAIQCLMLFARRDKNTMITPQKIANVLGSSPTYTSKILCALAKAEILNSRRGVHGGFRLNKEPEKISVLDVYHACQSKGEKGYCSNVKDKNLPNTCGYHQAMVDVEKKIFAAMKKWTIAKMIATPAPTKKLAPECKSRWTQTMKESDLARD